MSVDSTEFYQQIALILIPTAIGALTSKWITNSWQSKKEKNELKRKILEEYDNHIPKTWTMIKLFVNKMFESSSPKKDFPNECKVFINDYFELTYAANKFLRSLRLYYKEELGLEQKFLKIVEDFGSSYEKCLKFMEANNDDEIVMYKKEIDEKLDTIKKLMTELEYSLVKNDLIIR